MEEGLGDELESVREEVCARKEEAREQKAEATRLNRCVRRFSLLP